VLVTHGNGPQVGLLALQAEAYTETEAYPLDVLGAESEGMIGYLLEQELSNALPSHHPVVAVLTRVEVDGQDPALLAPTKPIGPVYDERRVRELEQAHGWTFVQEGTGWRRVVPSPEPRSIIELDSIRLLVDAGHLVVCGGGGGIPVTRDRAQGAMRGVEAVVDKDRSSAILALELDADLLLLLTDVPNLYRDWPECSSAIREATPGELAALTLDAGSMGPKVEAACHFVEVSGRRAAIGALLDARGLVKGDLGTQIVGAHPRPRQGD
jgi:carbamate kinase